MPRLIWAAPALRDVARLHDFLAAKNPQAARRAAATIRTAVKLLAAHPHVGRAMAEMPREWPISFGASGYVALYRLSDTEIVILAVRHSREMGY